MNKKNAAFLIREAGKGFLCLLLIQIAVLTDIAKANAQQNTIHPAAERSKMPVGNPVILRSSELAVFISRGSGLPIDFQLGDNHIHGKDSAGKIDVVICRLQPRAYYTVSVVPSAIVATHSSADLYFEASHEKRAAASFHLSYKLNGSSVTITMEKVKEHAGYELIEASLANLVTVKEEDGAEEWLAHGIDGGAMVNLADAKAYHMPDHDYFGRIAHILPVAIAGTSKMECVLEVSAFMDATEIEVTGKEGNKHARLGTIQTYRVHGGRSYNMNDGNEPNRGNANTPNLIVGQTSRCRLDFIGDRDNNGLVNWLDGARLVADRMPPIPTTYFNDKFVYIIGGKYKTESQPRTTFAQSEQLIRDIAMLTDYAPQVSFLGGWVYSGQDTGFPSEDSVNESLGGKKGLQHLRALGKTYHSNVTFNVNYDDAYQSSPVFDTAFIARRPDGAIWKSRNWFGEDSYIVGMSKYMKKWGMKRIDYMMNHYKIHDAILIDALSWFAIRNDWDPSFPASGYKNLVEGRYPVIDAFRRRGVEVISEQLRYPYIGKLALSADGDGGGTGPFGGEMIPFLATIYRKSAIWGAGGFDAKDVRKNLFWNCRPTPWYIHSTDRKSIADYYYMTVLPYSRIHDKAVESYVRKGMQSNIGLEGNSGIMIDWSNNQYTVIADGVAIAADEATFCSLDDNRIALYSRHPKELSVPLPKGWKASEVVGRALYTDRRTDFPIRVIDANIRASIPDSLPVILYRSAVFADLIRE